MATELAVKQPAAARFKTKLETLMTTNQTTALQKAPTPAGKPSALGVMANRLSVDPTKLLDTLKATVFQKANTEELMALVVVSNEYHLNPFLKEIYAFPAKGGGIVPIVSVDGWNKMLIRQPDFDGIEFEFTDNAQGALHSCTATIYLKNRSHPVKITEYFEECHRNTDPWNNMPRRMLRNRTLCQASRIAFGFSGVYSDDEAANVIDVETVPAKAPPKLVTTVAKAEASEQQSEHEPGDKPLQENAALAETVIAAGFTFDDFRKWAIESGNIKDADSLAGFQDVSSKDAIRLLRAKAGLLKGLEAAKTPEAA